MEEKELRAEVAELVNKTTDLAMLDFIRKMLKAEKE